jgi:hypothetical protein
MVVDGLNLPYTKYAVLFGAAGGVAMGGLQNLYSLYHGVDFKAGEKRVSIRDLGYWPVDMERLKFWK